jgi:hypothetical protein
MKHLIIILLMLAVVLPVNAQSTKKNLAESKAGERSAVDLTIYNANLALIREERALNLQKGLSNLVISDIPSTIDGTSLHFMSKTAPDAVRVLEQNYQYDLVNQAKLLNKYVGQNVEWIRVEPGTNKEYTVQGKLLASGYVPDQAYPTGGMVAEINGKIELNPSGRLILPQLPEGLILKPQLEWLIENSKAGRHQAEISYLAHQLTWNANYVALLDKDDKSLSLTGWVTITNNCGTSFLNAGLKLVAGDVNIIQPAPTVSYMAKGRVAMDRAEEAQFKESGLFEYHLYTLQRRTDVMNDETKQIELVSANGVNAQKIFVYDGMADQWKYWRDNYSYRDQGSLGQQSNTKVGVYVTFKNSEKNELGIPLPKGKVRVYKRDDDGKEQFVGEDQIDHTPKDEQIRLYMGNAFDLVGERAQKDFKVIVSGHIYDESFEIKVRNHKNEDATVYVYEHPWRWNEWEITKSSAEWTKVDQTTLQFPVTIPKNGEKVITYTIRYKW